LDKIEYKLFEGIPNDDTLGYILIVSDDAFSYEGDINEYKKVLSSKHSILTCVAFDQGEPVGFKIGWEERPYYFESWRGGVIKTSRRKGIAQKLTQLQHNWCEERGFRIITTICSNDNNSMITLNLNSGFHVTGTLYDRGEHLKVYLQKKLEMNFPDKRK